MIGKLLICLGLPFAALAACGEAARPVSEDTPNPDARTELEKLWPGQRMPDHYAQYYQAALIKVDLEQGDDAVSGKMTLTINAADLDNCATVSDDLEPWMTLCQAALDRQAPIVLSSPVTIRRINVTQGDRVSPMGAYASFETDVLKTGFHTTLIKAGAGSWELRPRPTAEMHLGEYEPSLTMSSGEAALSGLDNSRQLIAEKRTKL